MDKSVALRKESVDRNSIVSASITESTTVALRKESVDRNLICFGSLAGPSGVALRKESVDRNYSNTTAQHIAKLSLSARRAWIEIIFFRAARLPVLGRSPQGERG